MNEKSQEHKEEKRKYYQEPKDKERFQRVLEHEMLHRRYSILNANLKSKLEEGYETILSDRKLGSYIFDMFFDMFLPTNYSPFPSCDEFWALWCFPPVGPERGQYKFMKDLVRSKATKNSKKGRKIREAIQLVEKTLMNEISEEVTKAMPKIKARIEEAPFASDLSAKLVSESFSPKQIRQIILDNHPREEVKFKNVEIVITRSKEKGLHTKRQILDEYDFVRRHGGYVDLHGGPANSADNYVYALTPDIIMVQDDVLTVASQTKLDACVIMPKLSDAEFEEWSDKTLKRLKQSTIAGISSLPPSELQKIRDLLFTKGHILIKASVAQGICFPRKESSRREKLCRILKVKYLDLEELLNQNNLQTNQLNE